MTPKLPRLTGKDLLAALGRLGFQLVRIRGSHHFVRHPDGRQTVVPVHAGEGLGPGLMNKILHECEVSREELTRVL